MSDITENEKLLDVLHTETAKKLLERIQSGEATAAELNAAIRFLKDNGIDTPDPLEKGTPVGNLAEELPFQEEGRVVNFK